MPEVLNEFLERAILLDEDKEELRKKRGFTDDVIGKFKLRSACQANKVIIEDLVKKFGRATCAEHGLVVGEEPTKKLLERNIIIPYLEKGDCVALRPHKDFIKGKGLHVFFANENYNKENIVILTEGEFKAIAATVYGYQAIAIPGISSFIGEKQANKRFVEFIESIEVPGIEFIVIVFDNENKSDPTLPKYKPEPEKRYDTQYYAYLMAYKINEYDSAFEAKIAWIPDKYRDKSGKADIDGLLAAGVSQEEFNSIMESLYYPEDFFRADVIGQEAVDVISAKLAKRDERIEFSVKNGCYFRVTENKKGEAVEEQVSNFTLKYLATYIDENGDKFYEFSIKNSDGNEGIVKLSGEECSSPRELRPKLVSAGRFIWSGSSEALDALFVEIVPKEEKLIEVKHFVGWDEKLRCYFFDNCAILENGEVAKSDPTGLIQINNKFYKTEKASGRPDLAFFEFSSHTRVTQSFLKEVGERLIENYGTPDVLDAFAWMIAAAYKPYLFKMNRTFPVLGIFGKKSCGKTRLMQWLMQIFYKSPQASLFDSSTKASIRNTMAEFSHLPVWIDEFRNSIKGKTYIDIMRGVYDHSTAMIAERFGGKTRMYHLHAALAVSGEHIPDDETGAILQRMVILHLKDKPVGSQFGWFEENSMTFGNILSYLFSERQELCSKIIWKYDKLVPTYSKLSNNHHRASVNYALIHAIESEVIGLQPTVATAENTFTEIRKDEESSNILHDIIVMFVLNYNNTNNSIKVQNFVKVRKIETDVTKLVLDFNHNMCLDFYNEVARRTGRGQISMPQFRRFLDSCEWVEKDSVVCKIKGLPVRCREIVLEKAPSDIIIAAYAASEDYKNEMERVFGGEGGVLGDFLQ